MGYGRWRFETGPAVPAGQGQGQQQQQQQQTYAMVDRLCVLKDYRLRGFAKACLERIVHDVTIQTQKVGCVFVCLCVCVCVCVCVFSTIGSVDVLGLALLPFFRVSCLPSDVMLLSRVGEFFCRRVLVGDYWPW